MNDKTKLIESLQIRREPEEHESTGHKGRWGVLIVVIVILLAAASWWWTRDREAVTEVTAIESAVANNVQASTPTSSSTLDASGYVVARRTATVSATINGRVTEVLISEGSEVKAGDVLARLDDSAYRLQLAQAKASADSAAARLRAADIAFSNAEPTFQRAQKQREAGYLSAQELDTAKSIYDSARSELEVQREAFKVAQANTAIAERNLTETVIRAPFTGMITQKNAQPGEIVSPAAAGGSIRTGIGTIVDMDSLEVEVDVSENYINRVKPGQSATIKLNAYPEWNIPAKVIAIIPTAERAKATVKVRIGFQEHDPRILPDMGARVAFLTEKSP